MFVIAYRQRPISLSSFDAYEKLEIVGTHPAAAFSQQRVNCNCPNIWHLRWMIKPYLH